jgi:hypothetical protein
MFKTIYKMAGKKDPFARIPKYLLDDERLSWKAKGILCYLCGKPDGWKVRVTDVVNNGTDGKAAVRAALNELREFGYAQYVQPRAKAGVFEEGVWKISDTAIFSRSPRPDFPEAGKPAADNRDHNKKDYSKTHLLFRKKAKESKESSLSDDSKVFQAMWKPVKGTKAEQLAAICPPSDYPSEAEYDAFLEKQQLDQILMGNRGDFYRHLCANKWHKWDGRRWRRIRDWQAFVRGLDAKMKAAKDVSLSRTDWTWSWEGGAHGQDSKL